MLAPVVACVMTAGCATTGYESACHELASTNRAEIKQMVKKAQSGSFVRHVVLLETGDEIASKCRSYFVDQAVFAGMPGSLAGHCRDQLAAGGKYCTVYQVDGQVVKTRVF